MFRSAFYLNHKLKGLTHQPKIPLPLFTSLGMTPIFIQGPSFYKMHQSEVRVLSSHATYR